MKLIATILLLTLSSFNIEERKDSGCLKAEILLLADLSSSVSGQEQFIHDAVYTFIDKFELADNGIRVGLITFNYVAHLNYPLSSNKDSLKFAANYFITPYIAEGSTNLSDAFELAVNELFTNGRVDAMRLIIVISDGEPDDPYQTEQRATVIKSFPGTMIWGIFITKDNPPLSPVWYNIPTIESNGAENLKRIASPNCFIESDYNNLVEQIKKLDVCL